MIPARVALALQADGWYLRSDVIWSKPNPMPESVTDRPTKAHEYVFLLAKSERYFYDAEAIAEASDHPHLAGKKQKINYSDNSVTLRSDGDRVAIRTTTRNRRTVWTIATQPYAGAHFATMPEALIRPCILAGSAAQACERCGAPWVRVVEREASGAYLGNSTGKDGALRNDTAKWAGRIGEVKTTTTGFRPSCACENDGRARSVILDPFAGSGTTLKVAEALGRDAIGIELNEQYIDLQEQRTNGVQVNMEGYL